ncbi:hypothetical protein AJ78_05448 [Emergomyces pasteurianus Ep9510]|uniref:Glycosylphosphatidylinositol anchor biosynthesis protein 11 n=1 Tax=Emergomyces pasteurianus Ep9510 TaxID=1447872 RepID=A0A1J9PCB5_9EURO|nr:hypothetical protein AJ78_05448 [Emergomyces pasteurianus Ep9510]
MALPKTPSKSPSASTTSHPPHQSPSFQAQPQHPPISILSSPFAQTYAHIHPLLLLALFALSFRALVNDPVSTLFGSLAPLALLQGVYVIVCLPAATGGGRSSSGGSGGGGGSSGKIGAKKRIGSAKVVPALLSVNLPLILGTPLLSICLILFGAPFTTNLPATVLCAAHMSLLAGTSLIYIHGTDGAVWQEIWGISRAIDTVWGATLGVGLGAWFGAVPIPLDCYTFIHVLPNIKTPPDRPGGGGRKESMLTSPPTHQPALLSVNLPLILGTPLLSICLILFGAPFTTNLPATVLCAAHMSLLAGTSLIYIHGTDGAVWQEIWGISRAIDTVWGATLGVGLGYVLGSLVGRTPLLYGKRIRFTASEEEEESVADGNGNGGRVDSKTEKK